MLSSVLFRWIKRNLISGRQIAYKLNHCYKTFMFHSVFDFLYICGRMVMPVLIVTFCGYIYTDSY